MKEYLNTIDISSYNEGSFVGYFMVNLLTNMNILNRESISVISFNYTSTVELFPSIMTNISVSNKIKRYLGDVNYCHGKLTGSDVVFGVEDDAKIKKDHVFLRKATQFEAAIGSNKIYDVDSILRRKKNIIFIGHSLGKTDYSYFMDFFKDCCDGKIKNKNICFTYFNDDSKDKLYSEIDVLCNYQLSKLQKNNNISFIDTNKGEFTIKETKYIYPPVTP